MQLYLTLGRVAWQEAALTREVSLLQVRTEAALLTAAV